MTDYHISHQVEDELIDNPAKVWLPPSTWTPEQVEYLAGLGVDPTVRQSRYPILKAIAKAKRANLPQELPAPLDEFDIVVRAEGLGYAVVELGEAYARRSWPIGPYYLHRKGTPRTERAVDYPFRAMCRLRTWLERVSGSVSQFTA